MTPVSAHETNNNSLDLQKFLESIVVKVCLFRIILFIIISLPLALLNLEDFTVKNLILSLLSQKQILVFIISGLFFTLFILISWRFIKDIILFFKIQLICDTILGLYFMWITGGITSNASFILVCILFLYGRLLGIKTAYYNFLLILSSIIIMTFLQIKNPGQFFLKKIDIQQSLYFIILQTSALSLVMLLIKVGQSRENILLTEIAKQKRFIDEAEAIKTKIFDWIGTAIIVLDKYGTIKSINKHCANLLKISIPNILGKKLQEVFPMFYRLWNTWNKNDSKRHEVDFGSRILGVTLSPIPEQQGSLIIFTDITKIKEMEQKIAQMERLSLIGELSAGLAHEIKNPLSGIKGALQLLGSDKLDEKQRKRLKNVIMRDIGRLDKLLKDFLYFAKPKTPEKQKISLDDFLNKLIYNVRLTYPDLKIYITPSAYGKYVYWDEDQLKQVMLNLILNSIEAMNGSQEKKLVIGFGRDRDKKEFIFIQDIGCGIDESKKDQLFYPFFTTKVDGTGLGLSIAQRLCSENNSWIELKNREKRGVIAKIYLSNKGE